VRNPRIPALALMVASGCAGLGYQIVWTQQSALWLGHESAGVLATVAGFFGGLACGALLLGPRIHRSRQPARWYAACEAVIGAWSLVLALAFDPVSGWLLNLIGPQPSAAWHWSVAFCGTFLLLLPATAAMGATLPAMQRIFGSIPALYAANTFGAVLGVLGAAFWLVPQIGLVRTAIACAMLNFMCALLAITWFDETAPEAPVVTRPASRHIQSVLAATGLLGIGYEVLAVRVLSQVAENTVYTFAILLAVYLVGTAIGAAVLRGRSTDGLLRALAGACLLGTLSLAVAGPLKNALLQAMGASMGSALFAEAALAVIAFLLPTILMGALFSQLSASAGAAGISFGRSIGVNTAGAALAPFSCGVLLVPHVGTRVAMLLIATGYLLLSSRRAWFAPTQWLAAGATAACAAWAPSLAIVDVPENGRLVSYTEGAMASVSIVEDEVGVATLHIDNRQQEGSSATVFADSRQAWLPILMHPAPRRALFLGLGTGVTARSATADPMLEVDAVELLPEVIDASTYFTGAPGSDSHGDRLHTMAGDARRFVRASREHYDVIVADNFHPARSGSGSLYTVEHFRAVQARLAADGLFCQWLPLHQLDLDTLRSIVRSFIDVYPRSYALLATNSLETPVIGLIARNGDAAFELRQIRARLAAGSATDLALGDDLALLGTFIAGPDALDRFAGDAPLNTDDRPVVAYRAPRLVYAADSLPRDRLLALLRAVSIAPGELVQSTDVEWSTRLAAYWSARDRFLEVGRDVRPTPDVERMLAQVREPLLGVLRISPDFRPAYDPLLRMANALNERDPAAARALLDDLAHLQPAVH
jgi:spermidine synthase